MAQDEKLPWNPKMLELTLSAFACRWQRVARGLRRWLCVHPAPQRLLSEKHKAGRARPQSCAASFCLGLQGAGCRAGLAQSRDPGPAAACRVEWDKWGKWPRR